VSTVEDVSQPVESSSFPEETQAVEPSPPSRSFLRRRWIPMTAAAATLAMVGTGAYAWRITHHEIPVTAPITLPTSFAGLPALAGGNQYDTPSWRLKARTASAGSAIPGRSTARVACPLDPACRGPHRPHRQARIACAARVSEAPDPLHPQYHSDGQLPGAGRTHRARVLADLADAERLQHHHRPEGDQPDPNADGTAAVDTGWEAARLRSRS
jgi:hypothetical protein